MARVRVMTWNMENLFLPGDDAGPETQAEFRGSCSDYRSLM